MKLQAERTEGSNAITRYGPGGVMVNGVEHRRSVLVPWTGEVRLWQVRSVAGLQPADFEPLLALQPELVIFGSGLRMGFAPASAIAPLMRKRIGIECMDTAAACRTYNVLLAEGRTVVAALFFDAPA